MGSLWSQLGLYVIAALLGGCWRRWWGSDTQDKRGLRALQAVLGCASLFALCLWSGDVWWKAALVTTVTMGVLTERAFSVPIIWEGWRLAGTRIVWLRDKWTMGAELTAGMCLWTLATLL